MRHSIKNLLVNSPYGSFAADIRNWIGLKRLSFRNPERATMVANAIIADHLITQLPPSRSSFLDVGAHIGSIFSRVYKNDESIRVFAIEADPQKANTLKKGFPYCTVKSCAVGSERGKARLYLSDRSGYTSLIGREGPGPTSIEVDIHTLDELFPENVFDTVKIDIEGAELGALRGGAQLFRRSRPTLMFESGHIGENSLGYSAEKIWHWLDEEGFLIFTPDRMGHDAPPLVLETFLDAHYYPKRSRDFFAVAVEKRIEVRDRARRILGL